MSRLPILNSWTASVKAGAKITALQMHCQCTYEQTRAVTCEAAFEHIAADLQQTGRQTDQCLVQQLGTAQVPGDCRVP